MTAPPATVRGLDSAPTNHRKLLSWVREVAELTTPDEVVGVRRTSDQCVGEASGRAGVAGVERPVSRAVAVADRCQKMGIT